MFRISAILIALALACTPALSESESLISQELIKADKVNYDVQPVESGTFERTVSADAGEYYPHTFFIGPEVSGARFSEYKVSRGDAVKKGDVLAVFVLESDGVALASLELELTRTREALEKGAADREEVALEMQRSLLEAKDAWERERLTLEIQRAEVALEQYIFEQERAIADLEEQIEALHEEQAGSILVAPEDGVVLDMIYKRAGEKVYEGEVLITMYRTDGMLLRVNNDDGRFRYGMEVTVEIGSNKNRIALSGRVVGADTLIPTAERSGCAYIEFEAPEGQKLTRPTVSCATVHLENVLLVQRSAVELDGGKFAVTVLADGVPQKRYINCVVIGGVRQAWLLQGLEAGDEVIVD